MDGFISKLALGTVQLGLDYGINSAARKPSKEKSIEILQFACDKGIKIFDTAAAYGNAEEIVGEFVKNSGLQGSIKIITKLRPGALNEKNESISEVIANEVKKSLANLKSDSVDGYLLHNPEHLKNQEVITALGKLKREGIIKNTGVSIYEPEDALYAADLEEIDYIQIPYNILDQRLDQTNFFQLAKKNNKVIFARSAFLQGLFLMEDEKIPNHLQGSKYYFEKLDKILGKYQLSRKQAALLFSLQNKNIDYVVFGVDSMEQLADNIAIAERDIDMKECIAELQNAFSRVNRYIISPHIWQK